MLKAKINKEDFEGLSDEVKGHYKEDGDNYVLDVGSVDGFALENVTGLKSTVEKLRTTEKNLNSELKNVKSNYASFQEQFKDIDAEQARNALAKIDEIKDWDGETKVKEAVAVAEKRLQNQIEQLSSQHKTKVEELEDSLADSQSQLQDAIVNSKIIESITKEGGNINLLMPHVRSQVQMVKDSNGKWKPEVINKDGNMRIGDSQGNPMTITQLVQEMKSQDTFAAAFPGANSSGSGDSGDKGDGKPPKNTSKSKTISSSDRKAVSENLEKIASGEVEVTMEG